jgi:hypothetical protein
MVNKMSKNIHFFFQYMFLSGKESINRRLWKCIYPKFYQLEILPGLLSICMVEIYYYMRDGQKPEPDNTSD